MEDRACVLGLPKKDLARPPHANQLDGVSSKQLAYALGCIDGTVAASDVLECGGEHVPGLRNRASVLFLWNCLQGCAASRTYLASALSSGNVETA